MEYWTKGLGGLAYILPTLQSEVVFIVDYGGCQK